jgi:hypothetical protein
MIRANPALAASQEAAIESASLAGGDQPVAATYGGSGTPAGTLIAIQH